MKYIGIDPGLSGAVAVIDTDNPPAIGLYKQKEGICKILTSIGITNDAVIAIEKCHAMPKQGVVSMFNFGKTIGYTYGVIETIITLNSLNTKVVEVIPQKWQKEVLGEKSSDKEFHAEIIAALYPGIKEFIFRPSRLSKKGYVLEDGFADALCIAHYAFKLKL